MRGDRHGVRAQVGRLHGDDPITVSLSVTSARSTTLLPQTIYRIVSSVDCFIRVGGAAVDATTTSHFLRAGLDFLHKTDDNDLFVAGIVSSGSGTLFIGRIEPD